MLYRQPPSTMVLELLDYWTQRPGVWYQLKLTAAMDGRWRSPAGGCVTSAPKKMTGSRKTLGRTLGNRMLLIPPSFTLIFRHKLDRVWGDVLLTFLDWTHWVARPNMMSPTLFTSAKQKATTFSYPHIKKKGSCARGCPQLLPYSLLLN